MSTAPATLLRTAANWTPCTGRPVRSAPSS